MCPYETPRRLAPNYGRVGFDFLSSDDTAGYWFNKFTIYNTKTKKVYDESTLNNMTISTLIESIRMFLINNKEYTPVIVMENNHDIYTRIVDDELKIVLKRVDSVIALYSKVMIKDYIDYIIYNYGGDYRFNPKLGRLDTDILVREENIGYMLKLFKDDIKNVDSNAIDDLIVELYIHDRLCRISHCILTAKPKPTWFQRFLRKLGLF